MSDNGSVSDHINEFNMIVSQLNSVDIEFEDEIKAFILLRVAVPVDLRN